MAQLLDWLQDFIKPKCVNDLSTTPQLKACWNRELDSDKEFQKIYIMRHGERVDFVFGLKWKLFSFDEDGNYLRRDLNMPKTLPKRANIDGWRNDTPLTNVGVHQAFLTGEALAEVGVDIKYAYSSPAFRSIQTCNATLEALGLKDKISIRIEPGLYEWLGFYTGAPIAADNVPNWCTPEELAAANYNIDLSYIPIKSVERMRQEVNETIEDHYHRHHAIIKEILQKNNNGTIYISCHGGSLDSCGRQLMGFPPRTKTEFMSHAKLVPYCAVSGLINRHGKWTLMEQPCVTVSHGMNRTFDWDYFAKISKT